MEAFRRLVKRPVFSYGTVDNRAPGASPTSRSSPRTHPSRFKSEWSGRRGRNIHHKFVVTDFNLPTAKTCRRPKCSPDQATSRRPEKPAMATS